MFKKNEIMNNFRITFLLKIFIILFSFFVGIGCDFKEDRVKIESKEFLRIKTILENGQWAWDDQYCKKSPHTIAFDIENKTMTLILKNLVEARSKGKDTFIYDIKWAWKTGFRGKIRNEERVDKDGQTIEWDLFVVDENSFYWRRSDWRKNAASKPILKCLSPNLKASKN